MKTLISVIVLSHLYSLFLLCVFLTPAFLPERFATSFNAAGEAECWMDRPSYMMFISGGGSITVLIFVVIGFVSRFIPDKWINVPQREYWLAPEHRAETMSYLFRQMLWFASWMCCFLIALHFSTIHANRLTPPHLPIVEFCTILGCFLTGTLIWVLMFYVHFTRKN